MNTPLRHNSLLFLLVCVCFSSTISHSFSPHLVVMARSASFTHPSVAGWWSPPSCAVSMVPKHEKMRTRAHSHTHSLSGCLSPFAAFVSCTAVEGDARTRTPTHPLIHDRLVRTPAIEAGQKFPARILSNTHTHTHTRTHTAVNAGD